ncbi:hypothetical protein EBZ35_02300 [bacterium]|nr:hypothetical protein [bacterium]
MTVIRVAIVGATGLVGRHFIHHLASYPHITVSHLVGSPQSLHRSFHEVWQEKEARLVAHYAPHWAPLPAPDWLPPQSIGSIRDIIADPPDVVVSSIPDRAGDLEDLIERQHIPIVSNSPHRRLDPRVILTASPSSSPSAHAMTKIPNCSTIALSLSLAPVLPLIDPFPMIISTFQSLSGRGDALYPHDQLRHLIPLRHADESTESHIMMELNRLFPSLRVSVSAHRIPAVVGHWIDVAVPHPLDRSSLIAMWDAAAATQPIRYVPTLHPAALDPYHVLIGNLTCHQGVTRWSILIHNIMRGAVLPLFDSVPGTTMGASSSLPR